MLLAAGMKRVEGVDVVELPVADGGEGTAAVIHKALGGRWRSAAVTDPLGRPIKADWLLLDDGTVVVEAAAAAGLPLLAEDELDPTVASTVGFGQLLLATLADKPVSLIVGIGGTATVDGGVGMRSVVGSWLRDIPIRVACDVESRLLGERGAARVFGPQKGATPEMVEELAPYRDLPGAGAGGGLGAAFAMLGGKLVSGAELVLDTIGFDDHARGADLVVTGEGKVDRTTLEGKAPGAVMKRCEKLGVRCELFGGLVEAGIDAHALSGRRALAGEDVVHLGEKLALSLRG